MPYGAVENVASAPMMSGKFDAHICSLSAGSPIMCLAIHQISAMEDTLSHALMMREELGPCSSLNARPSHDHTFSIILSLLYCSNRGNGGVFTDALKVSAPRVDGNAPPAYIPAIVPVRLAVLPLHRVLNRVEPVVVGVFVL